MAHDGPQLTPREREVLIALCRPVYSGEVYTEPASTREIARELFVSEAAVKQHLLRLYDKFGIYGDRGRRRLALANEALRHGFGGVEMPTEAGVDPLVLVEFGREAMTRRSWDEAFRSLSAADSAGALSPADLELLGEAAVWTDHHDQSIDARQRAHAAYLDAGAPTDAARVAVALVPNHIARLNMAAASGWFNKAKSLLDDVPESVAHGELAAMTSLIQLANGEIEPGLESAMTAHRIGVQHANRDLIALGLVFRGYALARIGRLPESMALLDEAMASAVAGELGPFATAMVYCRTICTCLDLFDFGRAAEWTELVRGVVDATGPVGVAGDCRTHQVAVQIFRGEWADGVRDAELACGLSAVWDLNHTAIAQYELGELRRRLGDLDGAAEAFRLSHELGGVPHPGLALLWFANGDADGAAASLEGALAGSQDPLVRIKLLPAQVEIAVARGDLVIARLAAIEIDGIAERYGSGALRATAEMARGQVSLASGDPKSAIRDFRASWRGWQDVGAPYEAAQARFRLASALHAVGDAGSAVMEAETAAAAFSRLGATPDVTRAEELLAEWKKVAEGGNVDQEKV